MIACGGENIPEIRRQTVLLQTWLDGNKLKVDLCGSRVGQKALKKVEIAFDESCAALLLRKAPANIPEHALLERPDH